jgi:hypothetical protein
MVGGEDSRAKKNMAESPERFSRKIRLLEILHIVGEP